MPPLSTTGLATYLPTSNHLIRITWSGLGDEGWFGSESGYDDGQYQSFAYQADDGVDFALNLNLSTLDYGVFHLYPNLWGYPDDWGNLWITPA